MKCPGGFWRVSAMCAVRGPGAWSLLGSGEWAMLHRFLRYNIGAGSDDGKHSNFRHGAAMACFQPRPKAWVTCCDAAQRKVLCRAMALGVKYVQAFCNSPPVWMTKNRLAAGAGAGDECNLRDEHFEDFAAFVCRVCDYFAKELGVVFDAVAPFNEPQVFALHGSVPCLQQTSLNRRQTFSV